MNENSFIKKNCPIPACSFGAFLRHEVKCYKLPDGVHEPIESCIERFAADYRLDNDEVRGIINEGLSPSADTLSQLDLQIVWHECKTPTTCPERHYHLFYIQI